MKLQFGLLWIEDNYSSQEEEAIKSGAADAGFELEITTSKDGSDLDNLADHQRKFHTFDLVLLDLKLAGGVKGDELAPKVRQLFRSTPILFYSGSDEESALRDRMAKDKIEGVFCASRGNFTKRTSELIQDYAHTFNRLSGMRGLAMEVVAEVDNICRTLILTLADDDAKLEKEGIKYLGKVVCEQLSKNLDHFPALEGLKMKLDHQAVDSMKIFNTFRHLIKKHLSSLEKGEEKDRLSGLIQGTGNYDKDVIKVRNVLAHALEETSDAGWLIRDRNGEICMTVADFPTYRSCFLQHLRAMREISEILVPK